MEQRQQKSAIVLKYAKRRFDGGNECDLIRAIERQQDVEQLNRAYSGAFTNMKTGFTAPLNLAPQPAAAVPPTAEAPVKQGKRSKVMETLIRGPLQVCIGLVGMLTAGLAIVTFRRCHNEMMLQQSRAVFNDCVKAFRKGIWETCTSPVQVLKVALSKH